MGKTSASGKVPAKRDWRVELLGGLIRINHATDEEAPFAEVPTQEMLSTENFDYVAILFIADYCPQCQSFIPRVKASSAAFAKKRCKVLVCTNDRTEQDYYVSCQKTQGLDMLPYNKSRTRLMRDLFGLMTIPALVIVENKDFLGQPRLVTNARKILEGDPSLSAFPWDPNAATGDVTRLDRFLINGRYGPWYALGHRNVSASHPEHMYIDEHAIRARAGILNILSWVGLIVLFTLNDQSYFNVLFPLLIVEFMVGAVTGMTPIAPLGTLSALAAMLFQPKPLWRPAAPVRFANGMGVAYAVACLLIYVFKDSLGAAYIYVLGIFLSLFCFSTWLLSSMGFCVGCFTYTTFLVPWFELADVEECELSSLNS